MAPGQAWNEGIVDICALPCSIGNGLTSRTSANCQLGGSAARVDRACPSHGGPAPRVRRALLVLLRARTEHHNGADLMPAVPSSLETAHPVTMLTHDGCSFGRRDLGCLRSDRICHRSYDPFILSGSNMVLNILFG